MPKGKVVHHQRVIGRILRAASAAHFPVEQIEFTADGTIIVRPKASGQAAPSEIDPNANEWDADYGKPAA
jgi:hypothetical protein